MAALNRVMGDGHPSATRRIPEGFQQNLGRTLLAQIADVRANPLRDMDRLSRSEAETFRVRYFLADQPRLFVEPRPSRASTLSAPLRKSEHQLLFHIQILSAGSDIPGCAVELKSIVSPDAANEERDARLGQGRIQN